MIPPPRLLLASRSPRRQQLLRDAGYDFLVQPAAIDENEFPRQLAPSEVALHLARTKARDVAERFPQDVTLAADTLVVFGERIVGKPADASDARKIIGLLSGTTHIVITGVAVQHPARCIEQEARVMSAVRMRMLTPGEIDRYITSSLWQGKAGGYGIQDDNPLVERVGGCHTNIIGLPMKTTQRLLAAAAIEPARS
jgi:septum formation protein